MVGEVSNSVEAEYLERESAQEIWSAHTSSVDSVSFRDISITGKSRVLWSPYVQLKSHSPFQLAWSWAPSTSEAFQQPHRVQPECDRTLGKSQETLDLHPGACSLGHQQSLTSLRSSADGT